MSALGLLLSVGVSAAGSTSLSDSDVPHIRRGLENALKAEALLSAVEMEVFTELAKRTEDLATLQGRLGIHPRPGRDFFGALVALGFSCRVDGKYANTPETELFLDKHKSTYTGGMLEMANQRLYEHWSHLTVALRTGKQQNEVPIQPWVVSEIR